MTASITLSGLALASDGKTLTANIAGGTGTGYAITNTVGLYPHISAFGQTFGFYIASASVSGTVLTMNLANEVASGETLTFDILIAATLTDSGANTATGQTNLAVTNSSTATVRTINAVGDSTVFELNGLYVTAISGNALDDGYIFVSNNTPDFPVEFVTDATSIAVLSQNGTTGAYSLDGATKVTLPQVNASTNNWAVRPITSAAGAGKHLVQVNHGRYLFGVRLAGGTRSTYTVPTVRRTLVGDSTAANLPTTTAVKPYGSWKPSGSACQTVSYTGFEVDFGFTGSGVEISTVGNNALTWAVSIDGGYEGALLSGGDASTNGLFNYATLAEGLPSAAHTIHACAITFPSSTTHRGVRINNGTALTASSTAGATTLVVASVSTLAVNDWVRIDKYSKRECRQITGIAGLTLTLNAALIGAHAVGASVISYSAPVGAISAYSKRTYPKRLVAMGDSNTEAANDYGGGGTPDANGVYYTFYDPRQSPMYLAGDPLNIEIVNLGIQGQTSTQMAGRAADITAFSRTSYDWATIWAGTNDINSTSTTPATFQTNIQTMVTAAASGLKAGGKILLLPIATPAGATNAGGLSTSTANTALQAVQAANPTTCVYVSTLLDGLVAGDLAGVHYHTSGQTKIANNLAPYIGGATAAYLLTNGFFAV